MVLPKGKYLIGYLSQSIGNQHFFCQSSQKSLDALNKLIRLDAMVLELLFQVSVPHNGAGHQLWKHGDKRRKSHKTPVGRHVAPVHVDGVAHRLEGIKTDP